MVMRPGPSRNMLSLSSLREGIWAMLKSILPNEILV
jgi:hypothetical protein